MPTERFYRLPEEKQQAIRDAAVKEFIRVPFEKVSINQIIQNAEISRGSFYTYFEDKRDVLRYIFQDTKKRIQEFCQNSLLKHEGNYWCMMEELLDYCIEYYRINDLFQISKNVVIYPELESILDDEFGDSDKNQMESCELNRWVYEHMDKTEFEISSLDEFHPLMALAGAALAIALAQCYQNPEKTEKIKKLFHKKLEILQYGVCKHRI